MSKRPRRIQLSDSRFCLLLLWLCFVIWFLCGILSAEEKPLQSVSVSAGCFCFCVEAERKPATTTKRRKNHLLAKSATTVSLTHLQEHWFHTVLVVVGPTTSTRVHNNKFLDRPPSLFFSSFGPIKRSDTRHYARHIAQGSAVSPRQRKNSKRWRNPRFVFCKVSLFFFFTTTR